MDTLSPLSSPQTTPPQPSSATQSGTGSDSATALSSDFDTFLKMLTAQMRNQDPLNPVESADFAVQLATFSNVEQQVRTNELLESLGDRMGSLGMAQLSGWVGMEASAEIPVQFDGAPVTLSLQPETLADSAQLVVTNREGIVVQRTDVPAQAGEVSWAGVGTGGVPLQSGLYNIHLASFANDEHLSDRPVQVHARIVEARNDDGAITLVMEGGQEVEAADILSLRPAQE